MIKIAFIGGGSVMWTPGLVNDLALTGTLAETQLVLHDIDSKALDFMLPVAKRIVEQFSTNIAVTATDDRKAALQDADFVILCVAIGGLDEIRNDLEIPEKYGIRQSVGDTVGPGGLARGLRHIPFAVKVAREMEQLCPKAWLLNLTNPMSTICRGISKATSTPTIGLCHEVPMFRDRLATLFEAPAEDIILEVAGINHLPVITRCDVDGQDGFELLRKWLSKHDPYEFVEGGDPKIVLEVYVDHLAAKLTLFQRIGVLFGAGDRHVAEFLTGFLTQQDSWGRKYGIHLTTVDHREDLRRLRQDSLEYYAPSKKVSQEQLAPVIAALLGRPPASLL
jgi:alpha-galactosidase